MRELTEKERALLNKRIGELRKNKNYLGAMVADRALPITMKVEDKDVASTIKDPTFNALPQTFVFDDGTLVNATMIKDTNLGRLENAMVKHAILFSENKRHKRRAIWSTVGTVVLGGGALAAGSYELGRFFEKRSNNAKSLIESGTCDSIEDTGDSPDEAPFDEE